MIYSFDRLTNRMFTHGDVPVTVSMTMMYYVSVASLASGVQ